MYTNINRGQTSMKQGPLDFWSLTISTDLLNTNPTITLKCIRRVDFEMTMPWKTNLICNVHILLHFWCYCKYCIKYSESLTPVIMRIFLYFIPSSNPSACFVVWICCKNSSCRRLSARARTHTHYNNPGAKDVEEVLTPYCSALSITAYACPRPGGGLVPVQRIHKAYIAYHKMYF